MEDTPPMVRPAWVGHILLKSRCSSSKKGRYGLGVVGRVMIGFAFVDDMIRIRLRDTFWIEDTNNTEDCIDILFAINKSWVDELFDLLLTRLSLFCNIIDRQYINEKDVGI